MTTLVAKFDENFMNLPELNKFLGKEVVILINEKKQSNKDLRKFFDIAGKIDIDDDDETLWLKSISKNPAFEFLMDIDEDIYSIHDGEPLNA
ncbi:MAG: hypothetical protein RO257_13610 [Candidatus Kapabacteria bacterium]|nr:hypothetical protein [Candidatus Kapabacteria bacterium]